LNWELAANANLLLFIPQLYFRFSNLSNRKNTATKPKLVMCSQRFLTLKSTHDRAREKQKAQAGIALGLKW
jgi:hypothetical protein